ncbi:MAG TPA: glycosyltransferase [Candidatus Egerieimonas faecigallinarum]|nr:glycosyltransferase [Candidatus Egerieimonas faecigallinarum]
MGEQAEPFLSVIMPVYRAQEYLAESIESVLTQTFEDLELILVDDCSPDESGALCEKAAARDSRVRVLHLKENQGAGRARNAGIEAARGQYLAFMDADDTMDSDIYEKACLSLKGAARDMAVWGITEEYFDRSGALAYTNVISLPDTDCDTVEKVRDMIILLEEKILFGYQWNHIYRTELIRKHGIRFEESIIYEDYFFNLDAAKHIRSMAVLSAPGYHYKKRMNDSITTKFIPEYFSLATRRISSMEELYRGWGALDGAPREILGNMYLRYILSGLMRNCDPRAEMDGRERRAWVKRLIATPLYMETAAVCQAKQRPLRLLQKFLNSGSASGALAMGRAVYLVKEKAPLIFGRSRKIT